MNRHQSIKSFMAIVEEGSFIKAAQKHYCSSPKISKDINWLEDELQIKLFVRTTRKVSLTDAGLQFYDYVKQSETDYQEIKKQLGLHKDEIAGQITISTPLSFYEGCLMDIFNEFTKRYPNVTLNLQLTSRFVDLITENVDLALRVYHPSNVVYHVTELCKAQRGFFASKKYLKKYGTPKHPDELINHYCLEHSEVFQKDYWQLKGNQTTKINARMRCNSVRGLIAAALDDLGIIHFSKFHVRQELASGQLVEILKDFIPDPFSVYVCSLKKENLSKKTTCLIDFIKDNFDKTEL